MRLIAIEYESEFLSLVGRYYDPSTDQFLSVDPLVGGTGQPYVFAGDNPINASDPSGLSSVGFCSLDGCPGEEGNGTVPVNFAGSNNNGKGAACCSSGTADYPPKVAAQTQDEGAVDQAIGNAIVRNDKTVQKYFCDNPLANRETLPDGQYGWQVCEVVTDALSCNIAKGIGFVGIFTTVGGMILLAGLGGIEALPEIFGTISEEDATASLAQFLKANPITGISLATEAAGVPLTIAGAVGIPLTCSSQ
jgi:hypothetical protein